MVIFSKAPLPPPPPAHVPSKPVAYDEPPPPPPMAPIVIPVTFEGTEKEPIVVKTVPPDNQVVISEVLAVTLLCKEEISVFILETVYYVPGEGIILPEESNSYIVPSLLPVLGVNPEMLNEVTLGAM